MLILYRPGNNVAAWAIIINIKNYRAGGLVHAVAYGMIFRSLGRAAAEALERNELRELTGDMLQAGPGKMGGRGMGGGGRGMGGGGRGMGGAGQGTPR